MAPDTAPLADSITANVPAAGAAVAQDTVVGEAPYALTVTGVSFIPIADITGATATKRTMTLVNKGVDGNGATVVATLDFITGVNASDYDEKDFTLSVVAGALAVAANAILELHEVVTSTGTANPGGRVQVAFTRA